MALPPLYIAPNMINVIPARQSPVGNDQAKSILSSRYDIALDAMMLIRATAVSEAQMTAENPVIRIRILYKACIISSIICTVLLA